MGRKKGVISEEIKLERAKRFNIIVRELKRQNVNQKTIAEKMHLSQQSISKIVKGKNLLTEENARLFIDVFPGYCDLEWLLGNRSEEYRFFSEEEKASIDISIKKRKWIEYCVSVLAKANNYDFYEDPNFENLDCLYVLKNNENGDETYLSANQGGELISDICDYVGYRFSRIMEKQNKLIEAIAESQTYEEPEMPDEEFLAFMENEMSFPTE